MESYRVSERRACTVLCFGRSTHRYQSKRDEQAVLRMRIREIAAVRVRYGYRRIHILLVREGWKVNHKRVYKLYCEEGLHLRTKHKRKRPGTTLRISRQRAQGINDIWSMDFAADSLFDGRRFRALTIVDNFSRECLAIRAGQSIKGGDVVTVLNRLKLLRGIPKSIRVDNGSEWPSPDLTDTELG